MSRQRRLSLLALAGACCLSLVAVGGEWLDEAFLLITTLEMGVVSRADGLDALRRHRIEASLEPFPLADSLFRAP